MTFLEQLLGIKPKQEDKPTDTATTAPEQTQSSEVEKQAKNQPEQVMSLEQPTPTAPVEVNQTATAPKILPAYPIYPNMPIDIKEISDVPQLEMTFQQAQKAGFQFRFRKPHRHTPTVIITGVFVNSEQVIIPAKINGYEVTHIGERCKFRVKKGLPEVKVYLPNTVRYIETYAFLNCQNLTTVFFPEGGVTIEERAFWWIVSLKELHFGKDTDIGDFAFRYCRELETVELQECTLRKGAFCDCKNLRSIKWTKLEWCSDEIFYNTPIEKSKEVLILRNIFQKYNGNDKTFVVPDGVTKIGGNAFARCTTLEKVTLPPSVKTIEKTAFAFCKNLREINLEYVEDIYDFAFRECPLNDDIQFSKNVTFHGDPFSRSEFSDRHNTPDGVVVNGTLMTMGNNFVDGVWTISEGIRRISREQQESSSRFACSDKTVILPRTMKRAESLECFRGAKRIVIRNGDMWIGKSTEILLHYGRKGHFTLCFETESGISEFEFYYPKWREGNPAYNAVEILYKTFFSGMRLDRAISHYDEEILTVGLSYRQTLDIAYKRLTGGFELYDKERKRYMDFVRTHRKKGLRYATAEKNEQKIEFFKALFVEE